MFPTWRCVLCGFSTSDVTFCVVFQIRGYVLCVFPNSGVMFYGSVPNATLRFVWLFNIWRYILCEFSESCVMFYVVFRLPTSCFIKVCQTWRYVLCEYSTSDVTFCERFPNLPLRFVFFSRFWCCVVYVLMRSSDTFYMFFLSNPSVTFLVFCTTPALRFVCFPLFWRYVLLIFFPRVALTRRPAAAR